jgi:hypothetical protein
MTSEKARDFFSAYREGTLETGLRLGLERKFESDGNLLAEYKSFCSTLDSLEGLKNEVIELPFDLHDKISAHVDRDIWERKRSSPAGWFGKLRTSAFVGAGALVVFGAVYSLSHRGSSEPMPAGVIPPTSSTSLDLQPQADGLWVTYAPAQDREVVFRSGSSELPFEREKVGKNSPLKQRLDNPGVGTVLLKIDVQDAPSEGSLEVAVPGVHRDGNAKGTGTLEEFARALAGRFREAVLLKAVDGQTQVAWDFTQTDGLSAAQGALGDRFGVDQSENDLITIRRGK